MGSLFIKANVFHDDIIPTILERRNTRQAGHSKPPTCGYVRGTNGENESGGREAFMAGPELLSYSPDRPPARRCLKCRGMGQTIRKTAYGKGSYPGKKEMQCEECNSIGFFDIDPLIATSAMPGSYMKQAVLAARYRLIFERLKANDKLDGYNAGLPDEAVVPFHAGDAREQEEGFSGSQLFQ